MGAVNGFGASARAPTRPFACRGMPPTGAGDGERVVAEPPGGGRRIRDAREWCYRRLGQVQRHDVRGGAATCDVQHSDAMTVAAGARWRPRIHI